MSVYLCWDVMSRLHNRGPAEAKAGCCNVYVLDWCSLRDERNRDSRERTYI